MNEKYYQTCPKCGEKAILIKEIPTFDGPVRQYKCLNCNHIFDGE
ncbi:hypothetical protein [Methanobrevibacter sp. UBA212]|nr:hypothetical protein [Methanobrevibacter sp. UBA212]